MAFMTDIHIRHYCSRTLLNMEESKLRSESEEYSHGREEVDTVVRNYKVNALNAR